MNEGLVHHVCDLEVAMLEYRETQNGTL